MESKESEVHTNLVGFLAKRIVAIEAKLRALEITSAKFCTGNQAEFLIDLSLASALARQSAGSQFLSDLQADPEFAMLAPEVSELLH